MNELLLALKSSYSSLSRGSSSRGSSRTTSNRTTSSDTHFYDLEPDMSTYVKITPPPRTGTRDLLSDSPYKDPITPLKPDLIECDGDGDVPILNISEEGEDESPLSSPERSPHHHFHSPLSPDSDSIFTPRTRKKWSQCANNLFISYHEESSDSENEGNIKETSIDGIYIEFDNNIPKIVDKKRCAHISALARVTCVHHRAPNFAKRSASLKSRSCEKMRDEKSSTHKNSRPMSAGSPMRSKVVSTKPPAPNPELISMKAQCVDPLSYILDSRAYKPSRESLSDSTESASEQDPGSEVECTSDDESNKENEPQCVRNRTFSVDEHFMEEGRYHQVKEVDHDPGSLRQLSVPEDLYKAVQQRTPNDHIFVQYGKEVKRVSIPQLPIPLDKLLDRVVVMFGEALTADMVPLKALYIEDAQTKIFYQLDDQNDVVKGSHIKIHEDFVLKNIDRGSSQSLEDLNNSSNSSLSSGGFMPPPVSVPIKPVKRPGKSRLSLVEERLSMITHEMHTIQKSDTGSTVSSQTDFPGPVSHPPQTHLHAIIRTLYQNLKETKSELMILKRRELESRAEMHNMVKTTGEEISRHIEASLPQGIRRQRLEADRVEAEYRQISEETYSNIKDLERTVDVLKTDVVKRKVKLDPSQLETMEKELQTYTQRVSNMNSTFENLKENLKKVMKEELEIIVNEEQFLEDEEPMLEDVTLKCEELIRVMETLKKVAIMQKQKGSNPPSIYTASEYDVVEERHNVMEAIAAMVPDHDERILSIKATEEFRAAQKKFVRSESDCVAEEIQFKSQNLRKTNAFEELDRKRDEALKAMYTAQPPPHKFGRKTSQPQFNYGEVARRGSISKCKSMSSIAYNEDDSKNFKYADSDDEYSSHSNNASAVNGAINIKRSQSFTKEKEKQHSSEDEKTKKKTVFGFFSKKSKSKTDESKQKESNHVDHRGSSNGDVFVVDTAKIRENNNPPSPALIPRSYTEGSNSRKNNHKSKSKADRTVSVNFDDKSLRSRKGKGR